MAGSESTYAPVVAIILALAGLMNLAPVPDAAASADTTLSLSSSASAVHPGDTFSVTVGLTFMGGPHAVSAVAFRVTFDDSLMLVQNVTPGGSFPSVLEKVTTASSVGLSLSVGSDESRAVTSGTTVATIQFQAKTVGATNASLHIRDASARSIAAADSPMANIIGASGGTIVCIAADLDCSPPQLVLSKEKSKYNGWVVANMTGFTPSHSVTVTWQDGSTLCSVTADASGSASCGFRTPLNPLGTYTVTARDDAGGSATDTLRVIPRIKLTQYKGAVGSPVRVYFYGFAPGDRVEVWWYSDGTAHTTLKTITIASNGRGTALITIPSATIGKHMIRGKVVGVSRSASDYFAVTSAGAAEAPTGTASPSPSPTVTGTPEPTTEPSPTDTPTIEVTPEPSPTDTPPVEASPTELPTVQPTPTDTPIPPDAPGSNTPEPPAAARLEETRI